MDERRPAAQIAKAALGRLAQAQLEPTPENYARAYAVESGVETAPAPLPEATQNLLSKLLGEHLANGGMAVLTSHQVVPLAGGLVVQL